MPSCARSVGSGAVEPSAHPPPPTRAHLSAPLPPAAPPPRASMPPSDPPCATAPEKSVVHMDCSDSTPYVLVVLLVRRRSLEEVKQLMAPPLSMRDAVDRVRHQVGLRGWAV